MSKGRGTITGNPENKAQTFLKPSPYIKKNIDKNNSGSNIKPLKCE